MSRDTMDSLLKQLEEMMDQVLTAVKTQRNEGLCRDATEVLQMVLKSVDLMPSNQEDVDAWLARSLGFETETESAAPVDAQHGESAAQEGAQHNEINLFGDHKAAGLTCHGAGLYRQVQAGAKD